MENDEFDQFKEAIAAKTYPSLTDPAFVGKLALCSPVQESIATKALTKVLATPVAAAVVPRAAINNPDFDWLTYETLFNKELFRKSNNQIQFGLYKIPLQNVTVFLRRGLAKPQLDELRKNFFPKVQTVDTLEKYSQKCCPWQGAASGIQLAGQFVILPYNYFDNTANSNALATRQESYPLKKLRATWPAWKTASRTCVVRTSEVKSDVGDEAPWGWKFDEGDTQRKTEPAYDPSRYQLRDRRASDVSLKTGVQYVGKDDQSRADKDVLDGWYLGALRSDYVAEVDAQMRQLARTRSQTLPADLLVLTEILAVVETNKRSRFDDSAKELKEHDGVQMRDITPLDASKVYIPPTSIPFLDHQQFTQVQPEYSNFGDPQWRDFWKGAWAASLGRAKALFLMRYALQHVNPNPQNYLIEFDRTGATPALRPTGRMVIRDLTDAAIHREAAWALHGPEDAPPPDGDRSALKELNKPYFKYEFDQRVSECQETGSTNPQFGPPGTQLLWQRFSTFVNADKILLKRDEYEKYDWKTLLTTMAEWGIAHNQAYVNTIAETLDTSFPGIDWSSVPAQAVDDITRISASNLIKWEEAAAAQVHAFLKSPEGQQKLRAYRANIWQRLQKASAAGKV